MDENIHGSNLSYPVQVEKLEKLLQEKLGKNKEAGTVVDMLEKHRISQSTYRRILNTRKATEKTLEKFAKFLDIHDYTELIVGESKTVKERKKVLVDIKDNLEKADLVLLDGISELFKRMMPLNKIKKDTKVIGYKNKGNGKYEVVILLSSDPEWGELAGKVKTYQITVKPERDEDFKDVFMKQIKRRLTLLPVAKYDLDENPEFQRVIDKIGERELVEILPSPSVYMKILVDSYFKAMLQDLDESGQFQEDDVIEYIDLGEGVFEVTLPLDEAYCHQLGLDFPLKLEVEMPDDFDEETNDFEEVLKGAIEDQFHSDYDSLIEDDDLEAEFEEKMAELYDLPLEESIVHDFDELNLKENPRSNMCYTTLFQVLYLRGEIDEIPKVVSDAGYAYRKFKQFGIPVPFEKNN